MTSPSRRRGTVLVAALVCLLIVVTLLGAMLQGALREQRQMLVERDRRQCELLLQAGIDRAALRANRDAKYKGETWTLPASEIIGGGSGQVTIATDASAGPPRRFHVMAEYPVGTEQSIQRRRTISFSSKKSSPQE